MEKFGTVHTAQDLFEFLKTIPQPLREVLPITLIVNDEDGEGEIFVEAYEVRETEGCLERGFRLTQGEE